jgi:5'-3' exonuclease
MTTFGETIDRILLIDLNLLYIKQVHSMKGHTFEWVRSSLYKEIHQIKILMKANKIVICTEGKSWRKEISPYYKGLRKTKRDKTKYDWKDIWKGVDQVTEEIREHMPWMVMKHPRTEADDIIAILSKHLNPHHAIIVSEDHDFLQLLTPSCSIYHPRKRELVELKG